MLTGMGVGVAIGRLLCNATNCDRQFTRLDCCVLCSLPITSCGNVSFLSVGLSRLLFPKRFLARFTVDSGMFTRLEQLGDNNAFVSLRLNRPL
eukprot:scaffold573175_cov41-Prasinocladus_malaysianus.AAC.1